MVNGQEQECQAPPPIVMPQKDPMQSESIAKLAGALAEAQKTIQTAHKDKDNPFHRSKYADLASNWDACKNSLTENGLSVTQTTEPDPDFTLRSHTKKTKDGSKDLLLDSCFFITELRHESGEWIKSKMRLVYDVLDMQAFGSTHTYARRYHLAAIVGVAPADDDGEGAAGRNGKTHSKPKTPPPKQSPEKEEKEPENPLEDGKKKFIKIFKQLSDVEPDKYNKDWEAKYLKGAFGVDSIWKCKFKQLEKMRGEYKQLTELLGICGEEKKGNDKPSQPTTTTNETQDGKLLGASSKEYGIVKEEMDKAAEATDAGRIDELLSTLSETFTAGAIKGLTVYAKIKKDALDDIPF